MSKDEHTHVARIVTGQEPILIIGKLDVIAFTYLSLVVWQGDLYEHIKQAVGDKFDSLLRQRVEESIPHLLSMLRSGDSLHGAEDYVAFIRDACVMVGIPLEHYSSIEELQSF